MLKALSKIFNESNQKTTGYYVNIVVKELGPSVKKGSMPMQMEKNLGSREEFFAVLDKDLPRTDIFMPSDILWAYVLDRYVKDPKNRKNPHERHDIQIEFENHDSVVPLWYSPLVIVTTKDKYASLSPYLMNDIRWGSLGRRSVDYDKGALHPIRWTSSDSLLGSNTAHCTLTLLVNDYKISKDKDYKISKYTVNEVDFDRFFRPAFAEPAPLSTKLLPGGYRVSYFDKSMAEIKNKSGSLDFLLTYENRAAQHKYRGDDLKGHPDDDLVIYVPQGTIMNRHYGVILKDKEQTRKQYDAAVAFLKFLQTDTAQKIAREQYYLRPIQPPIRGPRYDTYVYENVNLGGDRPFPAVTCDALPLDKPDELLLNYDALNEVRHRYERFLKDQVPRSQ